MSYMNIDEQLASAELALGNARTDGDLADPLAQFGYDAERLTEGWTLYQAAATAHQRQTREYGEQFAASDAFSQAWTAAQAQVMRHVKVARIALKQNRGAYAELGLTGSRKRTLAGWLTQARQFYVNAQVDPEILTALARFAITPQKLAAGLAQVNGVEALAAAQQKEPGEAQHATHSRDLALESLDAWMSDFLAIARIALDENPQWLEKMGILARS